MINSPRKAKGRQRTAFPTYSAAMATTTLRGMLMRGFTTVRDMGGGDHGMKEATAAGFVQAPRLFISGRAISQTGGHGDFRSRADDGATSDLCCNGADLMCIVVDGVPEVIKAVRNQLRKGADQIKIMLSGGAASPNDPMESVQFSDAEITAAVDEATRWGVYVSGHAYSSESIQRGVAHGVRVIEHGNFLDRSGDVARSGRVVCAHDSPGTIDRYASPFPISGSLRLAFDDRAARARLYQLRGTLHPV